MKTRLVLILLGVAALALSGVIAAAQEPVVGAADPEALFTSKDPKLHANKQAAMHIMRDLLEAGHWNEAPKWLTERYIQHNPAFASGRQTVMNAFGARGTPRPIPNKNNWQTKIVSVVAEGDLVTVAVLRELLDPTTCKPYTTTWFDMWRFVDGKADEHWDYGTLNMPAAPRAGTPCTPTPARGGGQRQ